MIQQSRTAIIDRVVRFSGVSKSYGATRALQDVTFEIKPGQSIALVGPNGAGKSTLVETIMGLHKPDAGWVTVFGYTAPEEAPRYVDRIGVQLQDSRLFGALSARDYFAFFSRIYTRSISEAALVERFKLAEFMDKTIKELSGGQRQRVALALAVINDPDLIILDEPTVGLDPIARRQFWDLISTLHGEGKTLLFTTHYMDEAETLADHVLMLASGKMIAQGRPEEIIASAENAAVTTLDAAYSYHIVRQMGEAA
jgi:ABC-2 type transport system ATP-binding protein